MSQWRSRFQTDYAPLNTVWVATTSERIVGFLVLCGDEVAQIFVGVDIWGSGIGRALMDVAKQASPLGLKLTVLQQNTLARRFYEKHGFLARKSGINPVNGQPNLEYRWISESS